MILMHIAKALENTYESQEDVHRVVPTFQPTDVVCCCFVTIYLPHARTVVQLGAELQIRRILPFEVGIEFLWW